MFDATIDSSKLGFEISLGLTGVLTFWMGLLNIAEKSGITRIMIRWFGPFLVKLFPNIPKNHPVFGPILLNITANMLNLDNAATPIGLKAMEGMQELNPDKDKASNAQIMFLVLNTSGLTILPINIMVFRAQLGAANPADIFIPILIATFFSTIAGLIAVAVYQKINLLDKTVLIYLGSLTAFIVGMIYYFTTLDKEQIRQISTLASHIILFTLIIVFILMGIKSRLNVYETFIEGAKEGFKVAVKIIPYLVAMLVGIGVFRESGAMGFIVDGIAFIFHSVGMDTRFVDALPTAIMKPLSGSGARAMMIETMNAYGADSFVGRIASVLQGSTETTFYVLAVYFGAVNVRNTRYAVVCGLIADIVGIIAAISIGYLFFA